MIVVSAHALVSHTGITRHSPRNGFNGFLRAPRRPGSFATVIGGVASADLTPASGCQDHTTSPSALALPVSRAAASTAAHPYVRDVRETPLRVEWDAMDIDRFAISENQNIFAKGALQTFG
jgi:hypothetical protein